MDKLTFSRGEYDSAINDLSRSAAPMFTDTMLEYGAMTAIEDDVYIPMQDLGTTSQVMGIVVAFLEDAYGLVFKNGVWNRPGIFNMFRLGMMGYKMVKSVLLVFKRRD